MGGKKKAVGENPGKFCGYWTLKKVSVHSVWRDILLAVVREVARVHWHPPNPGKSLTNKTSKYRFLIMRSFFFFLSMINKRINNNFGKGIFFQLKKYNSWIKLSLPISQSSSEYWCPSVVPFCRISIAVFLHCQNLNS